MANHVNACLHGLNVKKIWSNMKLTQCQNEIKLTSNHNGHKRDCYADIMSISKLKYVLNHLIKIKENCHKMKEHTKTKELYYKMETSSFIFTPSNYLTCNLKWVYLYIYIYIYPSLDDIH